MNTISGVLHSKLGIINLFFKRIVKKVSYRIFKNRYFFLQISRNDLKYFKNLHIKLHLKRLKSKLLYKYFTGV